MRISDLDDATKNEFDTLLTRWSALETFNTCENRANHLILDPDLDRVGYQLVTILTTER